MNPAVNGAIFAMMGEGRITSATIMANGAAVEEAAERSQSFPGMSFGAHLNLTEFRPLQAAAGLAPLLDEAGAFSGKLRETRICPELREAIYGEWCAQVARLKALGVRVSHLDSHHHAHTVPALLPVLKRVQRRFGIRKVRLTKNLYLGGAEPGKLCRLGKAAWNRALRTWVATRTTSAFTGFTDFLQLPDRRIGGLRSIELMVHPGGPAFAAETAALSTPWRERLPYPTRFINYHDL